MPNKTRPTAKRSSGADLSPGLRGHIREAAKEIRAAHKAELTDVPRADRAGQLFRSIICPRGKPVTADPHDGMATTLANDLGGLLSGALRAGTGFLEGPVTVLTQTWMDALVRAALTPPGPGIPAAAAPEPEVPPAEPPVETAMPAPSPDEVMVQGALRRFLPMLVSALKQGGDGHGLAETVIALFGRRTYDQVCGLGKGKIMQIARAEPDLWAQIAPIEAQFDQFLDEFTGYDAWREKRDSSGRSAL